MKSLPVLLVVLFALAFDSIAQRFPSDDDPEIEKRVEQLLQSRDAGALANELAQSKAGGRQDLLIRLSVFARAGHRERLHKTLGEIGRSFSADANRAQVLRVVKRAIEDDDLTAQRIFYERFAADGDNRAGLFINAWRAKGDVEEIEGWLEARAERSETWWNLWVHLKKSLGTANGIFEGLEQKIRENPADYALVRKYLRVISSPVWASVMINSPIVSYDSYERDVSWLADVVKTDSAYENFDLAVKLQNKQPLVAAKLLEKSLSLPYTEKDAALVGDYFSRNGISGKAPENLEKDFRGWARNALVVIYQRTNRAHLAQPIVEALTADGVTDLAAFGNFSVAGAVQSATTARIVEAKILNDEKANEKSPDYWLNRVAYYTGRGDAAAVREAYRHALEKFPYKPNDWRASHPRMMILYFWGRGNDEDSEVVGLLRNEFIKARAQSDAKYLYELLRVLNEGFDDLREEFFVNTDLLPKVLAAKEKWSYVEEDNVAGEITGMIVDIMESEKWNAAKRAAVWNRLLKLAADSPETRAFSLVSAMMNQNEYGKVIPFLEECMKIAPVENKVDGYFEQGVLGEELFEAYLAVGDLRRAEKMAANGFRLDGQELGKIAVAAAKGGKINDAVRVWKIYVNLDRRHLGELHELSKTAAKTPLREYYTQMKAADAFTDVPDKALGILQ